nr:MAG TPA: hypothetical protein [Caudoviricetes sp.]
MIDYHFFVASCNLNAITICTNIYILTVYKRSRLREILIIPYSSINT